MIFKANSPHHSNITKQIKKRSKYILSSLELLFSSHRCQHHIHITSTMYLPVWLTLLFFRFYRQIVPARFVELMLLKCIVIQNDQSKSANLVWVFLVTCIYELSIELTYPRGFQPTLYTKGSMDLTLHCVT